MRRDEQLGDVLGIDSMCRSVPAVEIGDPLDEEQPPAPHLGVEGRDLHEMVVVHDVADVGEGEDRSIPPGTVLGHGDVIVPRAIVVAAAFRAASLRPAPGRR